MVVIQAASYCQIMVNMVIGAAYVTDGDEVQIWDKRWMVILTPPTPFGVLCLYYNRGTRINGDH